MTKSEGPYPGNTNSGCHKYNVPLGETKKVINQSVSHVRGWGQGKVGDSKAGETYRFYIIADGLLSIKIDESKWSAKNTL